MPALENPKHERFALLIARGVKQGEAYKQAGFAASPGAASRLAGTDKVYERVEELREEISEKIKTAMNVPTDENWESLADLGLSMIWVAHQYKLIYEGSMDLGQYPAANTAIANIQKLLEIEANNKASQEENDAKSIDIKSVLIGLDKVGALVKALDAAAKEPVMIDITPESSDVG